MRLVFFAATCVLATTAYAQHTRREALDPAQYRSVVRVMGVSFNDARERSAGSGAVILHNQRRYVVTNYHVVQGCRWGQFTVRLPDGSTHPVKLLVRNQTDDVAILDASRLPADVRPMPLASRDQAGGHIWILGYGSKGVLASSSGTISRRSNERVTEMAVTVAHGDSGGPVVNGRGEIVGLTFAKDPTVYRKSLMVPVSRVHVTLKQLSQSDTQCYGGQCWGGGGIRSVPEPREPTPYTPPPIAQQPLPQPPQQYPQPPPAAPANDPVLGEISQSIGGLNDSFRRFLDAQEAERQEQEADEKRDNIADIGGDAISGYQDGGVRGAVREVTDESNSGILEDWTTQLVVGLFGATGIFAMGLRIGIPWAVRFGLRYVNELFAAPHDTEADALRATLKQKDAAEAATKTTTRRRAK